MHSQNPQPATAKPATPGTFISGVASALLILFFFIPWFTACNVDVSGMDLATTGESPNWWLLGIPLVGLTGLVIVFKTRTQPPRGI